MSVNTHTCVSDSVRSGERSCPHPCNLWIWDLTWQERTSQTWNLEDPKMRRLPSIIQAGSLPSSGCRQAGEVRENVMTEAESKRDLKMLCWHLPTTEEGSPSQGGQQPLRTEKGKETDFPSMPSEAAQLAACFRPSSLRNRKRISLCCLKPLTLCRSSNRKLILHIHSRRPRAHVYLYPQSLEQSPAHRKHRAC